jgi:hypothetical protein
MLAVTMLALTAGGVWAGMVWASARTSPETVDPTSKPKTHDFVMSERTIEGIYSLDGNTLRLCQDRKRPVGFATQKDSQQVLFVLKRIHGPEVFPYRLADGSRAFPPVIERVKKATPPPQNAPTPKDGFRTGGDFLFLNSLEYQVPVKANDHLYLVAFLDSGTVERGIGIQDYRVSAGVGDRIIIPALGPVPIALDFGFPIERGPNDQTQVFSFWVGLFH